jgi:hypothetical protein
MYDWKYDSAEKCEEYLDNVFRTYKYQSFKDKIRKILNLEENILKNNSKKRVVIEEYFTDIRKYSSYTCFGSMTIDLINNEMPTNERREETGSSGYERETEYVNSIEIWGRYFDRSKKDEFALVIEALQLSKWLNYCVNEKVRYVEREHYHAELMKFEKEWGIKY